MMMKHSLISLWLLVPFVTKEMGICFHYAHGLVQTAPCFPVCHHMSPPPGEELYTRDFMGKLTEEVRVPPLSLALGCSRGE